MFFIGGDEDMWLCCYVLVMFLYLLGDLYMGYVENYLYFDIVVWFWCYCGYNVLNLIGWDLFGLLVENVVIC